MISSARQISHDGTTGAVASPDEPGRVLTNREFEQHVTKEDPSPLSDREVLGPVNLRGRKIEHLIEVRDVVFTHRVDLSNSTFERGLDLAGCRFMQGLVMANVCVQGPLLLDGARLGVMPPASPDVRMVKRFILRPAERRRRVPGEVPGHKQKSRRRPPRAVRQLRKWRWPVGREHARPELWPQTIGDFTNLRVGGALSLVNAAVYGGLLCPHADVEDDIRLDGARILGNFVLRCSRLGEFRTEGRILTPARARANEVCAGCLIGGDLELTSTHAGGDVRLIGATVRGQVSLQTAEVDGNVLCRPGYGHATSLGAAWFLGVRVKGVVEFTLACIRGEVTLDGGEVGVDVILSGAEMRGQVSLQNTVVGGNVFCRTSDGLPNQRRCRVGGDLWLLGAEIGGDLDLSSAWVRGQLMLQNTTVGQNLIAEVAGGHPTHVHGTSNLMGVKVTGSILWLGAALDDILDLDNASIGGSLEFKAVRVGKRVIACSVTKKLNLNGISVASVLIAGTEIGTDLEMRSARVGQNVSLRSSEGVRTTVRRVANLEGIQVSGDLVLAAATVEEALVAERASIGGNLKLVFDLEGDADWRVERTRLGSVRGESASVGKDLVIAGAVVGSGMDTGTGWSRGVDLSGVNVGGKLQFQRPGEMTDNLHTRKAGLQPPAISPERERELTARADLESAEIHGNLNLARAEVRGDLVLDGITVQGGLDLRNARVGANLLCRAVAERGEYGPREATAHRADLETLEVSGDAELTGLLLAEDLILRDCRIRGQLRLVPEKDVNSGARIGGIVDLDAAEIAHAVLSGANVPAPGGVRPAPAKVRGPRAWVMRKLRGGDPEDCAAPRPTEGILVLERASIRKLEIRPPLPDELYLSDMKVASWDESVGYFKDMLPKTRPFRKSCYVTIEGDLRNKGRDADADNVHVWMRRRDRQNSTAFWPVLWDRVLDATTRYGTSSRYLFCLMLLWFACTVFVFLDHEHVRYDIAPTALHTPPPIREVPAERWNTEDAVFMAVRLHVPIVALGIDEPVQPRQTWVQIWALMAIAASWLMWPLFIASASGYLRRRT